MSEHRDTSSPSRPRPVPKSASSNAFRGNSPVADSASRATITARLASPVPSSGAVRTPSTRPVTTPDRSNTGHQTPLAGAEESKSSPGPGQSALAAALQASYGRSPPRFGTPPLRSLSPTTAGTALQDNDNRTIYGSVDTRSVQGSLGLFNVAPNEDRETIRRHLVQISNLDGSDERRDFGRNSITNNGEALRSSLEHSRVASSGTEIDDDGFSSLQLQGGDITRQVYRWTEDAEAQSQFGGRGKRSQSFHISRPHAENEVLDINSIKVPGGFRRNYLRRNAGSPSAVVRDRVTGQEVRNNRNWARQPHFFTNNFIEFLTLYGHFAGEELEEDDENLRSNEYYVADGDGYSREQNEDNSDREPGEGSALLAPKRPGGWVKKPRSAAETSAKRAALLLLKSFVGTGVLFLPKAFLNGGMLFSNLVLIGVAGLSYYCFILLVKTRLKVEGSFGDIGGITYGKWMRRLILTSIVVSQIGFVSAYIVFTSENLQAFILAVSHCRTWIDIKFIVLMQLIIFLPLSLIRDISKLGFTALVADAFILCGLVYLYYYDVRTLVSNHGAADYANFNSRDWTLFIGTAIFTFEGIGLIIPIQESMRKPTQFPAVLGGVMILITTVFVSMGALSYAAYGSSTKTVIILNLPQDDKMVNGVQFLYSLAILLSTPLQLFPAIRIMENELFTRSGKHNRYIKWKKNGFRFCLVMLCAFIAWGGAGDLDKFVSLIGSVACVPLVYIYPPLLHLKAVEQGQWQRRSSIILCVFGLVVMVYTSVLTTLKFLEPAGPKVPGYCDE